MAAVFILVLLAAAIGGVLGLAAVRFKVEGDPLIDRIDKELPQTQCGQCGFPGCRPYATSMAAGESDINQCPPGGQATIDALADLLGVESKPLNPDNGVESELPTVAWIDEQICIGCTKCIQACPIDAILGANKLMHTVITSECTGCDLCVEPCPVDCIYMLPIEPTVATWQWPLPIVASDAESINALANEANAPDLAVEP